MLPVPYAFSKTGVLLGSLVMLVVAGSNCLTSLLLLRAAGKTGHDSYEGVALAVGGQKWKVPSSAMQSCCTCFLPGPFCSPAWRLQLTSKQIQHCCLCHCNNSPALAGGHADQPDPAVVWHNSGGLCLDFRCLSTGVYGFSSAIKAACMACCLRRPRDHVPVCACGGLPSLLLERHAAGGQKQAT